MREVLQCRLPAEMNAAPGIVYLTKFNEVDDGSQQVFGFFVVASKSGAMRRNDEHPDRWRPNVEQRKVTRCAETMRQTLCALPAFALVLGSDPIVQFSDDPVPPADALELVELSDDVFWGDWSWRGRVDGGVIGPLAGDQWSITIDQLEYSSTNNRGISSLFAFGPEGSPLGLRLLPSPSGQLVFRPLVVPEPASLLLVFAAALSVLCRNPTRSTT